MLCRVLEGGRQPDRGRQGSDQTKLPCRVLRSKRDVLSNLSRWRMQSAGRNLAHVPRRRVLARRIQWSLVLGRRMLCRVEEGKMSEAVGMEIKARHCWSGAVQSIWSRR